MVPAGWKMLGLLVMLAGGTGLGAVLATFVDPVPRQPDPWPTQLSGRPEFSGAQSYRFVEVGPEDLSPPSLPDSYAPGWADDDEGVWAYPEPAPFPNVAELDAQLAEDAVLLDADAESSRAAPSETVSGPAEPSPPSAVAEAPTRTESRLAGLY